MSSIRHENTGKAYVSSTAPEILTSYLVKLGYAIEKVVHDGVTYHPVSTHPDIFMCRFGVWENTEIFPGNTNKLTPAYPGNIIYNAVCTGKYFIHNLRYTDPELLEAAKRWAAAKARSSGGLAFVNVPQGYTRCCCLPVDDTSFVTSDEGIAKALIAAGAEVLIIEKGHILLPEFDYGFIGGCAGHLKRGPQPERTIIFNGDLSAHPDHKKITAFIEDRDIEIVYFKDYPLTDIGSIISD